MPQPKHRLSLDELRVTSFAPLPEREDEPVPAAARLAPTAWTRCSLFICD